MWLQTLVFDLKKQPVREQDYFGQRLGKNRQKQVYLNI